MLEFWYPPNDQNPERANLARMNNRRGMGKTIAILDCGFNVQHCAIRGRVDMERSRYFYGNDLSHPSGHGTLCAAIAAGISYNGFQGGVACNAQLVLCKVHTYEHYINALTYINTLCNNPQTMVHVVSMSGGFCRPNANKLQESINELHRNGVICVAAPGNKGDHPINSMAYPAKCNNVIAVGSHDHDWKVSGFSPSPPDDAWSFFTSLGENIFNINASKSKKIRAKIAGESGEEYDDAVEGTSFSTPAVAGLIACILEAENNLPRVAKANRLERILFILNNRMIADQQSGVARARALYPNTYFDRLQRNDGNGQ